jgi:hypothetical protein
MAINRTAMIDYDDARIAQTNNPKHAEQLTVLRAHMVAEINEDVDGLLAPALRELVGVSVPG